MAAAGLRVSQTAADRLGFSPNHNQHHRLQCLQSTVPQAVVWGCQHQGSDWADWLENWFEATGSQVTSSYKPS